MNKILSKIKKPGLMTMLLLSGACSHQDPKLEIKETFNQLQNSKDIKTAPLPKQLRQTQKNYISLEQYVKDNGSVADSLMWTNAHLYSTACREYEERIGKNFQLTQFFSKYEIQHIQNMIKKELSKMESDEQVAAQRVINKTASLQDLCTLCTYLDYEFIQNKFINKIYLSDILLNETNSGNDTWLFDNFSSLGEVLPIKFSDSKANKALVSQFDYLLATWAEDYAQYMYNKSLQNPSIQFNTNRFSKENGGLDLPNFNIPEMKKIKPEYMKNKKIIDVFLTKQNQMFSTKDSLQQYIYAQREILCKKLDSLNRVK